MVRRVLAGGLLVGAAAIIGLPLVGADTPPVPPSLVLLIAAGPLVHRRWTAVVGVLVAVAEIVGLVVSGSAMSGLIESDSIGIMVCSWARMVAMVVAIVAGVIVTAGSRTRAAARPA